MQLVTHNSLETVLTLSERNIRELFEGLSNPHFHGLLKLQESGDPVLDQRLVTIRVER